MPVRIWAFVFVCARWLRELSQNKNLLEWSGWKMTLRSQKLPLLGATTDYRPPKEINLISCSLQSLVKACEISQGGQHRTFLDWDNSER